VWELARALREDLETSPALPAEAAPAAAQPRDLQAEKDAAYRERDRVVALVARMAISLGWRAGLRSHEPDPDPTWDEDWKNVVLIDLPSGQVSWHYHDSERPLFASLPPYPDHWDGHDTAEKYRRVEAAAAQPPPDLARLAGAWEEKARDYDGRLVRLGGEGSVDDEGAWFIYKATATVFRSCAADLRALAGAAQSASIPSADRLPSRCDCSYVLCNDGHVRCRHCGKQPGAEGAPERIPGNPCPECVDMACKVCGGKGRVLKAAQPQAPDLERIADEVRENLAKPETQEELRRIMARPRPPSSVLTVEEADALMAGRPMPPRYVGDPRGPAQAQAEGAPGADDWPTCSRCGVVLVCNGTRHTTAALAAEREAGRREGYELGWRDRGNAAPRPETPPAPKESA
jgi:hypothetical protein